MSNNCSICLNELSAGSALLTLSCNHKFHLQCLALNLKAKNKNCPLCRVPVDSTVLQLLNVHNNKGVHFQQENITNQHHRNTAESVSVIPSVEDPVDETVIQNTSNDASAARQANRLLNVSTTLEYMGQLSDQESNIYGMVTLRAPSINYSSENNLSSRSRVPIDLICIVDQSGSMGGNKMVLLKKTLIYICEQLNDFDRLAIVSFDKQAFNRSHGLKRMNQQNQSILKNALINDLQVGSGTFIGCGLQMGIDLFNNRQTRNRLSALLLLTDGQDNRVHDYSDLMQRLPQNTPCHTFGYGRDHQTTLLVQLAEQSHGGTFTYIDKHEAIGPAFASTMAGLLTCVAQQICVNIQFNGDYQVTHTHSKYEHEPQILPSSKLTFKLSDLNADESRHLLFQLHVPQVDVHSKQSSEFITANQTITKQSPEEQQFLENDVIGHVSVNYIEPSNGHRLNTQSVPFHLIRSSSLLPEHCQVNHQLDVQRNRIETAFVLNQAVNEKDYQRSLDLLKRQVKNIEKSVSAQDPLCQQLIKDLQYRYPTERDYRLSQNNAYLQHASERSTYHTPSTTSVQIYQSPTQHSQMTFFTEKYTKNH